jgi:hypothetical protein
LAVSPSTIAAKSQQYQTFASELHEDLNFMRTVFYLLETYGQKGEEELSNVRSPRQHISQINKLAHKKIATK